jgi:hypothetical protein
MVIVNANIHTRLGDWSRGDGIEVGESCGVKTGDSLLWSRNTMDFNAYDPLDKRSLIRRNECHAFNCIVMALWNTLVVCLKMNYPLYTLLVVPIACVSIDHGGLCSLYFWRISCTIICIQLHLSEKYRVALPKVWFPFPIASLPQDWQSCVNEPLKLLFVVTLLSGKLD